MKHHDITLPNIVTMSRDGRLYLTGGHHRVAHIFASERARLTQTSVAVFEKNHSIRRKWCEDRGITYSQWVFPDPILFQESGLEGMSSIVTSTFSEGKLPDSFYYPLDILDGHPDRQSVTDSHYSPLGNMYVASKIAEITLGAKLDLSDSLAGGSIEYEFCGDLGVKCNPPLTEDLFVPRPVPRIVLQSNGIRSGNNGAIFLVESENSITARKLLIFGDSFLKLMLPELSRYWRRIIFLRSPFFHFEMVKGVAPDDILCGMAERYFASPTPDSSRPHFLAYPLLLGRSICPTEVFAEMWVKMVDQRALGSTLVLSTKG